MIDSYEWENAGILGCRHFHFEFSVLGYKHAVPEMIALWKMHTDLMIGVIVCPITSGDTAFRSARLVLADWFKVDQNKMQKRLMLCVPLLAVGAFVGHLDYAIVWRYFSWTNQTLAMIVLWTASMYLFREKKNYWITAVPATFMSAVSMTYFFCADECLGFSTAVAYPVGIILAALFLGIFIWATRKPARKQA